MTRSVSYSGVVIGVESVEGFGDLLVVQGEVDGVSLEFYLKPDEITLREIQRLGIGVRVEGTGIVLSEEPLVVAIQK